MPKQSLVLCFFFLFFSLYSLAQDTTIYMQPIEIIDTAISFDATKLNQFDSDGKKHGYWKEYYVDVNKKMRYQGQFNHGTPIGLFNNYYNTGVLKAQMNYFNEGRNAAAHLYYPTGKIMAMGLYHEQKKDSLWRYYQQEGYLVADEFYRNAQKNGPAQVYQENGSVLEESNWVNDKQDGIWKQFYPNTTKPKFIMHYKNGLREGSAQFFYESGAMKGTGFYEGSHRDSVWIYYQEDGGLQQQIIYKNGTKINTFIPDNIKKEKAKEDTMMGDKKIENIEELDDKLQPFIDKY